MAKTKAGFGSFNSGNVEDMITDDSWVPPSLPPFLEGLEEDGAGRVAVRYGSEMRRKFMLEPGWTFVNHGAFGSPLACAFEMLSRESVYELRFIDRQLFPYLVKVTKQFSDHVDCDPRDLVLLPNATSALNAVIQSVPLGPGDSVMMFDSTYASVKKMVRKVCQSRGAVAVEKALPRLDKDLRPHMLVEAIAGMIPDQCRLVLLDHVTSNDALEFPLNLLVPLFHSRGALVLVDGAHGLSSTKLKLREIDADYYAGNCHKWFCAPRGVGFLHVNHSRLRATAPTISSAKPDISVVVCSEKTCERIGKIKATEWGGVDNPIISHGYGAGFLSQFVWDGARDYSAFLAVEQCLDFWRRHPSALDYSRTLLLWASSFLSNRWGTGTLLDDELSCATMNLVLLPRWAQMSEAATGDDAQSLQDSLYALSVECPVKVIQGKLFIRISAWIYNEPSDYVTLAKAIEQACSASVGADEDEEAFKAAAAATTRLAECVDEEAFKAAAISWNLRRTRPA